MKKVFFFTFFFFCCIILFSQPIDTARFRLNFTPKLQNFFKITQTAVIPEATPDIVEVKYEIEPQQIEPDFAPTPLKPVKVQGEVMKRLYRNFLKVGIGFPLTPLSELCIHNFDNSKFSYGVNINHISAWAPPIGKEMQNYAYAPFSDTRVHLFLNTFFKNQTLYSSIGYNHKIAHLFGFSRENGFDYLYYEKPYRNTLKNNFHHAYAEVGFRSNFLPEDAKLKQDVRINYDLIYSYKKDRENKIGVASTFAYDFIFKKLNGYLRPQLDFNLDYFLHNWSNQKFVPEVTAAGFKLEFVPTVKFAVKEYYIRVGMGIPIINSLNNNMQGDARVPVFPVAEVQLGLVPGTLSIYGGVDGSAKYNSFKELIYENPFLKPGLDFLTFERTQISLFGGVKGNIFKKMNYHISARYSQSKDMVFFILDTASLLKNQFDVIYKDADVLNVCANLNWQVVQKLYLNLEANYWGYYRLDTVLYKPDWEMAFSGKYFLKEKFILDFNMNLMFNSFAMVPYLNEENQMMYSIEKMKPVLNFGVGFEYLFSKRFSCFATVNNVGFQHYAKYYDFKNLGFNAIVGITYSFGDESLKRGK